MSGILFYTSGDLATKFLTGGIKRFMELVHYGFATHKDVLLCSRTDFPKLQELGVDNHVKLMNNKGDYLDRFLFPELASFRANYYILKSLKKSGFDNIVVFDVPPAVGLVLLGFRNINLMIRRDLIGYERVANPHKTLKYYVKILVQWLCEEICIIASKKVITQCYYDRDQLIVRHPLLNKCINRKTVIQINNVNPSWAINSAPVVFQDDVFRVCFIGNFSDIRKGHDLLLGAAQLLLNEGCNMEFIVVGDGVEFEQYKKRYQHEKIRFTGRLKSANDELLKSTILVVPSRADSCPNTVLEALYSGIPVIGSKAGGIPEILNINDALFELTIEGIADKLRDLYMCRDKLFYLLEKERIRREELEFNWPEKIFKIIEN